MNSSETFRQKLTVVIPAHNEQTTVGAIVREAIGQLNGPELAGFASEVIVVDDGSQDATSHEARRAGACVLRHVINCGLGAAIGTGFEAALRRGATIVVTLDADGQHDPRDIPQLIAPILSDAADVVIGSRLLAQAIGMPLDRRLINWGANVITWLLFGAWTTDSQSGLRALNRRALEQIHIKTNRMEVASEIIAETSRLRLRLAEVPIAAVYTDYSLQKGQTNANSLPVLFKLLLRKLR